MGLDYLRAKNAQLLFMALSTCSLLLAADFVLVKDVLAEKPLESPSTNQEEQIVSTKPQPGQAPLSLLEQVIDDVIIVNTKLSGKENQGLRRAKLYDTIAPYFDFNEMSRRSLGAHWSKTSTSEQDEYTDAFSRLLSATYVRRIDQVDSDIIKFDGEKIVGKKALVKTRVEGKQDSFPIIYKLINKDGTWRIYDVIIENIGLVANYRNEFAGIIRKHSMQGLIDKLAKKVEKLESEDKA